MRAILERLPSPAMVVACAALVVALGGVSYAAGVLPKNSVGTAQLRKQAVTASKLRKNAVTSAKVQNGTLIAADFKPGQLPVGPQGPKGDRGPTGDTGATGSKGEQGIPGTARAYGRVAANGTFTRARNVNGVTNPATGIYCIALTGIDAGQTGLVVVPDVAGDDTYFNLANAGQAIVEWDSNAGSCPAGRLQVDTARRVVSTSGSVDSDVRTVTNARSEEPFFFVVP